MPSQEILAKRENFEKAFKDMAGYSARRYRTFWAWVAVVGVFLLFILMLSIWQPQKATAAFVVAVGFFLFYVLSVWTRFRYHRIKLKELSAGLLRTMPDNYLQQFSFDNECLKWSGEDTETEARWEEFDSGFERPEYLALNYKSTQKSLLIFLDEMHPENREALLSMALLKLPFYTKVSSYPLPKGFD